MVRVSRRVAGGLFAGIVEAPKGHGWLDVGRARLRDPPSLRPDRPARNDRAPRGSAFSFGAAPFVRADGRPRRRTPADHLRRAPRPDRFWRSTTPRGFISTISSSFDPLFRVLFTLPSQYFFAIGLVAAFGLGWDPPPAFGLQSQATRLWKRPTTTSSRSSMKGGPTRGPRGCHPPGRTVRGHSSPRLPPNARHRRPVLGLQFGFPARGGIRLPARAVPSSFATTRGIPVGFFSSAYRYA